MNGLQQEPNRCNTDISTDVSGKKRKLLIFPLQKLEIAITFGAPSSHCTEVLHVLGTESRPSRILC